MSKKQWAIVEANKIIRRAEKRNSNQVFLETGYGPSGLPHIGTFAEVARTTFVMRAVNEIAPHLQTTLIVFSDDMDGLRAVPTNIPNRELTEKHLGKPLSDIPDPYGVASSYASYMNDKLKDFLNSYGFEFSFKSSTIAYKSGLFNDGLKLIMQHREKIIDIFTATIAKEKRSSWSPFFPTCKKCGKNTTTIVTDYDQKDFKIQYICDNKSNPNISPCGHKDITSIFDGNLKVGWKVDWALRWFALNIDYEMYGKDLIDSASMSEKIIKAIGGNTPITYKYELFLDETGKKISKKIGNGVSLDEWLDYAPLDALLYFLYNKPNQPKKMSTKSIPGNVDNYLMALKGYDKYDINKPISIIKYKEFKNKSIKKLNTTQDFTLICNLVNALNLYDEHVVFEYLERYEKITEENKEILSELVKKAIKYSENVLSRQNEILTIDSNYDQYLSIFIDKLNIIKCAKNQKPEDIQTACFAVSKENSLTHKLWFTYLYQILLAQESGPKLGSFIAMYGIEDIIKKLIDYLEEKK